MTKSLGVFLHQGRHVGDATSEHHGEFPVNHIDANFAIASMKILFSYATRILQLSSPTP
jgi:hypothetical protein